jgi:hypothetical protein
MEVRNALLLAATALLLSSCVAMVKMEAGPVTVKEAITVTSDGKWNRLDVPALSGGSSEIWTSDGLSLDLLTFHVGIKDGEPLAPAPAGSKRTPPAFRASMVANEIVELYEATATQDGSTFKLERLAPVQFSGVNGFRFEFSVTRKHDGVALRGIAHGATIKGKLYLIAFRAPRLHYYAKHLPRAETAIRSALVKS